ncbi:MAG TPA: hypothetical protein VEW46_19380 [Pyrinomonadaceae bacterium]|nr:hypothetical protein [Pyrinomonadaceae bacterium]
MSLNERSATALVRFTGLGIICFNKDRQRGEIAAIRDNKHTLSIKIQKPVLQEGGGNDVIVYQDLASYQKLPKADVQIEIKALKAPAIKGYEIYQPGSFDRLDSPDINDFRWIVNMNSLHIQTDVNPNGTKSHPLTKIYLGNGLFYTHRLDTNMFFEKVEKGANGAPSKREVFGNVGETIGVKIEGDEVGFTIRIGDKEESHLLQRVDDLPYRIEIKNMDYSDDAVYSDMADYYGYLSSANGTQFDFARIVEDDGAADGGSVARGPGVNQKEFCHPIVSDDLPSIDALGGS